MRFGLVGLGWAGGGLHLPAVRAIPGAEVAGGVDVTEEARAEWERETGTPAFGSLSELLAERRPDVVVIGTPPDTHAPLAETALAGGAHVICEKPFVATVAEADRVLAAAAAADRHVAVNHPFRVKPIFRALQERIDSEEHGRLVFCQVWQLMDLAPWDEPVPWRAAMPNRTLYEGGVHLVDLLLRYFRESPAGVYARHSPGLEPGRDADAIHLAVLDFPDGRLAQLTIDRLCQAGTRYVEVRADCEEASLRASHGGRAQVRLGKKRAERSGLHLELGAGGIAWVEQGLSRRTIARNPRDDVRRATADLFAQIAAALEAGREPPSSGREAREVIAVIEAAYRSAASGRRVPLAEVTGGAG